MVFDRCRGKFSLHLPPAALKFVACAVRRSSSRKSLIKTIKAPQKWDVFKKIQVNKKSRRSLVSHQNEVLHIINTKRCISSSRRGMHANAW